MNIHYLKHVPFEGIGNIEKWALENNFSLSCTKLYENSDFPETDSFDFLVVMGGPMNIYEEDKYPWLKDEKVFIKKAIETGIPVLGICLGSQLIADVLGAKVYKNSCKEIGWFPVEFTEEALKTGVFKDFPRKANFFHWHGDTFDIPENCTRIGSNEACKNQGFVYNDKVVALQFHPESNYASIKKLIENCEDELKDKKYIQSADFMLSQSEQFEQLEKILHKFLNNFILKLN